MLVRARPYLNLSDLFSILNSNISDNESDVCEFERKFCDITGAQYCSAVDKGRIALFISLKSIGIVPGDEIIVQNLICSTVIDVILDLGAIPVLVDNSLTDFNISLEDLKRKITSKTKAIIVAHLYGLPANIQEIKEISQKHSCFLIEDCAHAITASYNNKKVGSFGDLAIFSFNFDKPFSTGNGGMIVVNNPGLIETVKKTISKFKKVSLDAERIELLALLLQHFLTKEDIYQSFLPHTFSYELIKNSTTIYNRINQLVLSENLNSFNELIPLVNKFKNWLKVKRKFKQILRKPRINQNILMNSVRARLGLKNIEHLNIIEKSRQEKAQFYIKNLKNNRSFQLPLIHQSKNPSFLRYSILNHSNYPIQSIINIALKQGIEIGNFNWPYTIHMVKRYRKKSSYDQNSLQASKYIANNIINLPTHYYVQQHHQKVIIQILNHIDELKNT